jgi:DNA topoisomerase-1
MQQQASSKLGFAPRRTMAVAQQLYEGIDLGGGEREGLITYMRTDSTNVARAALVEVRAYIAEKFGGEFLPAKARVHKTRAAKAQEAHECIRPTSVRREPNHIKEYLSKDQYRLYRLIWQRFVASQMEAAIYNVTSVDIKAGRLDPSTIVPADKALKAFLDALPYLFRASSSTIAFPGFLLVYGQTEDEKAAEEETAALPPLTVGEILDLIRLFAEQHFTQPPPRFTEASLIRELEKHGIGRPSTYASILSTIQFRGYVNREKKHLIPTDLGFVVNDLLVEHFSDVVNVPFTAQMEEDLDRIATGERDWVAVLRDFYGPFERQLKAARQNMPQVDIAPEETGMLCEKCGHPMIVKAGRYGKFIACSNFPKCRNTKPYMIKTGATCPQCGGDLVERRSRKGRTFYGCANYPDCDFATWQRPIPKPCPNCGGLLVDAGRNVKCTQCGEIFEKEMEAETST